MSRAVPSDRSLRTFAGLCRVVAILRGPDGCPWDRVQSHESLRPYLLEETAEVLEALDCGDPAKLKEELADLLFEIVIHAQLAGERGDFAMSDVIYDVSSKLVRRHPHVFGDASALTPEAVIEQWDELKKLERGPQSAIAGIPPALPALAQAQALQRRAGKAGFEWETPEAYWEALSEELGELRDANEGERAAESGDALFAVANLVRSVGVDAEDALRQASRRFSMRFIGVEKMASERGIDLESSSLQTKLELWEQAKREQAAAGGDKLGGEGGKT
jgi:tetrapyrrole methylase family protein/MazG family protein